MNDNIVQNLSSDAWSSEDDYITIENANPYERKGYFNRYFLAAQKAIQTYRRMSAVSDEAPINIIDAACGDGTGTAFLAEQFPQMVITGIDLCREAIDHAVGSYAHLFSNVKYQQGDILQIDSTADIFCCMETLEHVSHEKMHAILEKIAKDVLRPGGRFVVSMPRLRPRESTRRRPGHINELYHEQFRYTLGEYFPMMDFVSFDRYANIVPETPDANLMVGICYKWPMTRVF